MAGPSGPVDRLGTGGVPARLWAVEAAARSAFHLMPAAMMLGIVLFYGMGLRLPPIGLVMTLPLAALAGWKMQGGTKLLAVAVAAFLAGQALCHIELLRTSTTVLSGSATVRVDGRVVLREADEKGRMRYVVDVLGTSQPVLSRPPERIRLAVSSRHDAIPIGGRYRGLVRIGPPAGPAYPGAHDFAFGPYFAGVGAYGFGLGPPLPPDPLDPPVELGLAERLVRLRVAISERVRAVVGGAEGAVAAALISGERAGIPDEIDDALRVTGLSHVLSISGFHMALVAGFVMALTRMALALWPRVSAVMPVKKIAAVAALSTTASYMAIAGPNVATERSFFMIAIMLGAVLLDRPALTLRNVSLAATLVLAIGPSAVLTASFQMSFAATAALVGVYAALARRFARRSRAGSHKPLAFGFFAWLAMACLASAVAAAATAPFAAYHFQRLAPWGLIANVATMPLFSLWIMPLALIATLLMPVGLDAPFLTLLGWGMTLVFKTAILLAGWFPDHPAGLVPLSALVCFSLAILAACFLASHLRWIALPLAVSGILLALARPAAPVALIFEDGRKLAILDDSGTRYMGKRPGAFVADQWERAFGPEGVPAFNCVDEICRAETTGGLRIAWTETVEKIGEACENADIAVIARAIKLDRCPAGATLVTLRTLRQTGSLAIYAAQDGTWRIERSVPEQPAEWNSHRHQPWPEFWKKPPDTSRDSATDDAVAPLGTAHRQAAGPDMPSQPVDDRP